MVNNDILELLLSLIHNFLLASSGYLIARENSFTPIDQYEMRMQVILQY